MVLSEERQCPLTPRCYFWLSTSLQGACPFFSNRLSALQYDSTDPAVREESSRLTAVGFELPRLHHVRGTFDSVATRKQRNERKACKIERTSMKDASSPAAMISWKKTRIRRSPLGDRSSTSTVWDERSNTHPTTAVNEINPTAGLRAFNIRRWRASGFHPSQYRRRGG